MKTLQVVVVIRWRSKVGLTRHKFWSELEVVGVVIARHRRSFPCYLISSSSRHFAHFHGTSVFLPVLPQGDGVTGCVMGAAFPWAQERASCLMGGLHSRLNVLPAAWRVSDRVPPPTAKIRGLSPNSTCSNGKLSQSPNIYFC